MGKPHRNRDRKPGRREEFREPRPIILIVCEGQKTEPQYFKGLNRACHNPRVVIELSDSPGVPKTLVGIAKRLKNMAIKRAKREDDDNLVFDEVWCVFDIDDHPLVPETKLMAEENGIKLAISNPCFELWLLPHFQDSPGMHHRDDVRKYLKAHIPDYDKDVQFAHYSAGYSDAVTRAKQMDKLAADANSPGHNPSTSVHELTESIRGDSKLI